VAQPPDQPARRSGDPGSGGPNGTAIKAAVVLVAFVITTVLVLGVIHPTAATIGTAASPSVSTTTKPPVPTTTTTTTPPHVPVLAANASGVPGAAGSVTTQLQTSGWDMLPPVNASARVTVSNVYYVAGQKAAAQAAAKALLLPASSVVPYTTSAPVSSIGTAEVLIVVGPDLATRTSTTTSSTVN
jgi:LytR cell envelope-related transcriptional attenuator